METKRKHLGEIFNLEREHAHKISDDIVDGLQKNPFGLKEEYSNEEAHNIVFNRIAKILDDYRDKPNEYAVASHILGKIIGTYQSDTDPFAVAMTKRLFK